MARVCSLVKERVYLIDEMWDQSYFFFQPPEAYDAKMVKKKWKENTPELMGELKERLAKVESFEAGPIKQTVKELTTEKEVGMGQVMLPFRITLVGTGMGPDVAEIAEMIGRDETLLRMEKAIEKIG